MGAAVALRNVVGVGQHLLLKAVVPLHGDFDADAVLAVLLEVNHFVQRRLVLIEVLHEGLQTALVGESVLLAGALVRQADADAGIQESQFPKAFGEHVVVELDVREGAWGRLEVALGSRRSRLPHLAQGVLRHALLIHLLINKPVAPNGQTQLAGKGVHHGHAYAMQPAGNLIAVVVEFAAGMEGRHDDLGGGDALLWMSVNRNAAAVVPHRHRLPWVDNDLDVIAMTRQRLVYGVVHQFLNHVVQASAVLGVAYVHAGPLTNRVQPSQHLDVAGIIGFLGH